MDCARRTVSEPGFQRSPSPSREVGSPPLDAVFAAAYAELYELASAQRRRWRGNETLNTTALVHETYLKLARQQAPLRNPECLLAVAARAMRHVLVNYAEQQQAAKRGGPRVDLPLAIVDIPDRSGLRGNATADEVLALNEALDRLAALSTRQRDVVECRFFGGMSVDETASALNVSSTTVKRDWRLASAWLHHQLRSSVF